LPAFRKNQSLPGRSRPPDASGWAAISRTTLEWGRRLDNERWAGFRGPGQGGAFKNLRPCARPPFPVFSS
jgi:hypothetical protein